MFSALGNAKLNYIVKAIYPHRSQGLLRKKATRNSPQESNLQINFLVLCQQLSTSKLEGQTHYGQKFMMTKMQQNITLIKITHYLS